MPMKSYKPTSPGRRGKVGATFDEITRTRPEKSLLGRRRKHGGRNDRGVVTVRHRGGGNKRKLRVIDFKRDKVGVPGKVAAIEYDPNRTARIALIHYADGDKRYILAPTDMQPGDEVKSDEQAERKSGNAMPLERMPVGTSIHNIGLEPGRAGQVVRSAGTAAQILGREEEYVYVRLPSGEVRRFHRRCWATIGQIGNIEHKNVVMGKAGVKRWLGRRPEVRGSAMTPRDHPHGGGEGRAPRGMPPKTPWGKAALGRKTRRRKRSDRMIIRRRK